MDQIKTDFRVIIETLRDRIRDLWGWSRRNGELALAIACGIVVGIVMLSVVCCSSRVLDRGEDPAHNTSWKYRANGTLTFYGEGSITGLDTEYTSSGDLVSIVEPKWFDYRDKITAIDIGEDITYVSMDSFVNFTVLEKITVRGQDTGLDLDCIRYEDEEGWVRFGTIIIAAPEGSAAQEYAQFNALEFLPL